MKTPEYNIYTKKVSAGQFKVTVVDSMNDIEKSYLENDMTIIDALDEEDSAWDAMQTIIAKAGFKNF